MARIPIPTLTVTALVFLSIMTACQTAPSTPSTTMSSAPQSAEDAGLASGFYWRPASVAGRRWVILLPGASGLKVFDDEGHYFRAADALNARGFDALVIDYKHAYKAAPSRPNVPTGKKIAWVVEQAVAWARHEGKINAGEPGAIIAWSLGAEALWPMLPDAGNVSSLGIKAAAAYYPSNEDATPIVTPIPLLILVGEKDDITPAADTQKLVRAANSTLIEFHLYPGANHGFDIASIQPPRTVRLLPLIGPSGTFGYDRTAADTAGEVLGSFLDAHLPASSLTATIKR